MLHTFRKAAEKVSAVVFETPSVSQALDYAVDVCARKDACQPLVSGCAEKLSVPAGVLCDRKRRKVLAAPALAETETRYLASRCHACGIDFVRNGLRDHLAGIDVGLTMADYGVAETGTIVVDCADEEVRLATMISEVHVALLPGHHLYADAFELEQVLAERFAAPPNYCAFITGPSRTADIERVLALGVHGPLELHIVVIKEI